MPLKPLPIGLLGLSVSNLTLPETVSEIQMLIENYQKDLRPHYIATLNVDFIVNIHTINSSSIRFPELLKVLQHSSLVTLDGMPLVWLSRLLGSPFKERVTGIDLLPKIAESLHRKNQSLFLLGGDEKTLKLCSIYLQADYPGLRMAGTSHPLIPIEGENLETAEERDKLIVEHINRAAPDVLLLNLGNPKQEIWFERIRNKLHVPVTIGVGGAFNLLVGRVVRAPVWMQNLGLEWVFRLFQEPHRLFSRYIKDLIKFPLIALPLVAYQTWKRVIYNLFYRPRKGLIKIRAPFLFISKQKTIAVVQLPVRVGDLAAAEILQTLANLFSQDIVVLDFKKVKHIDLEGIALFLEINNTAEREKKQLHFLNLTPDIKLLFRLHRLREMVEAKACHSPSALLERFIVNGSPTFLMPFNNFKTK